MPEDQAFVSRIKAMGQARTTKDDSSVNHLNNSNEFPGIDLPKKRAQEYKRLCLMIPEKKRIG